MRNVKFYGDDFRFHYGNIHIENGRIAKIEELSEPAPENCDILIPGLIDIHNHGNSGTDLCDGDYDGLIKMAGYLAKNGITSFAPASLTVSEAVLDKAYRKAAKLYREHPAGAACLRGINMEGPFFSYAKRGAQNPEFLRKPDLEMFKRLDDAAEGLIKIVDIAPELDGALDFISEVSKIKTVSIGHTQASYEEAKAAINAGATHVTHLFNGMEPLHHRNPGPIAAASEAENVRAELISDGYHVHPGMVRLAFKLFGAARICLVSDALSACGMPEGEYMLGGQKIIMKDNLAKLTSGAIAGSAINLFECMRRAISFGISEEDAVRAATFNPACAIGAENEVGSISEGKIADLVLCDAQWNVKKAYLAGNAIW